MTVKTSLNKLTSYQQLSMWLSHGLSHDKSTFNLLWEVNIKGELKIDRLSRAIDGIIQNHEALRACFYLSSNHLEQSTLSLPPLSLDVIDMRSTPKEEIIQYSIDFGSYPYRLEIGPLFRFELIWKEDKMYKLLCGFHHLVMDGTSWNLFKNELFHYYSFNISKPNNIQYAEFNIWQQRQLNSENWKKANAHIQNILSQAPSFFRFKKSALNPSSRVTQGGWRSFTFNAELTALLRKRSSEFKTSPFRIAFAIFCTYFHTYFNAKKLGIATTLVGRSHDLLKSVIGMFVNNAIITTNQNKSTTFRAVLSQIDEQINLSVEYQDYPFYLALQKSSLGHTPNTNVVTPLAFTKRPASKVEQVSDLEISNEFIYLPFADRDLTVYMQDDSGLFNFLWVYRTIAFNCKTIEKLSSQFENLARIILKNPDLPIQNIDVLLPEDRKNLFASLNGTNQSYSNKKRLHLLIEEQVERTPDQVAVIYADQKMTYREINDEANKFALKLAKFGIGRGCFVPILINSSINLLIAELAILKTGAAFSPVNPGLPEIRINLMLNDLGSNIVVVDKDTNDLITRSKYGSLLIDEKTNDIITKNPKNAGNIFDPIYCIFTSGSTGMPKGAINQHAGIINRLLHMNQRFGIPTNDKILAASPASFDSHVWQYFWPLMSGGVSVIPNSDQVLVPRKVIDIIAKERISITDFVPSVFNLLVEYLNDNKSETSSLSTLRQLLIGGEKIIEKDVFLFQQLVKETTITNTYGPTETSIGIIFHQINDKVSPIPIGKPIPNVKFAIVNKHFKIVPIGTPGELCIGGVCVGLGYLNKPNLTKLNFVVNPFPELECDLLYKSGDLVALREDGNIEYLGRLDRQIKINGIRIEPEEIEAHLLRYDGIEQVSVITKKTKHQNVLRAYLTVKNSAIPIKELDIRNYLSAHLPQYSIPTSFIQVNEMPVNANGKVDYARLAKISGPPLKDKIFVLPTKELEFTIVEIWKKILHKTKISIGDNFFLDLGGDSLKAIIFINEFENQTDTKIEVQKIYDYPTPKSLSQYIDNPRLLTENLNNNSEIINIKDLILQRQKSFLVSWKGEQRSSDSFLYILNRQGKKSPLFWCFQGQFEFQKLATHLSVNQPVAGMRSGHLVMEYSASNVCLLAEQYASEIMEIQPTGDLIIGGNCQATTIAQKMAEILLDKGRNISWLLLMEHTQHKKYVGGKTALIYGRDSHLNYILKNPNSESALDNFYPKGYEFRLIDGTHGTFFSDQNIESLGATITLLLSGDLQYLR